MSLKNLFHKETEGKAASACGADAARAGRRCGKARAPVKEVITPGPRRAGASTAAREHRALRPTPSIPNAHTIQASGLRARTFFSASTAACSSSARCSGVGRWARSCRSGVGPGRVAHGAVVVGAKVEDHRRPSSCQSGRAAAPPAPRCAGRPPARRRCRSNPSPGGGGRCPSWTAGPSRSGSRSRHSAWRASAVIRA